MLELVEPLLQADLLHLQQGAILDFIQGEAVLLSKVVDQRVLWAGRPSGELAPSSLAGLQPTAGPHPQTALKSWSLHPLLTRDPHSLEASPTDHILRSKVPPLRPSGCFPDPSHPSWETLKFLRVWILDSLWDSWPSAAPIPTHTQPAPRPIFSKF